MIYIHLLVGKNVFCIDEKIIYAFFEGFKGLQGDVSPGHIIGTYDDMVCGQQDIIKQVINCLLKFPGVPGLVMAISEGIVMNG
jgi:hypothetical protein